MNTIFSVLSWCRFKVPNYGKHITSGMKHSSHWLVKAAEANKWYLILSLKTFNTSHVVWAKILSGEEKGDFLSCLLNPYREFNYKLLTVKICLLSSSIGKTGKQPFFPVAKQLPQNTTQLRISTGRNAFLTNLLFASALIPSCKNIFTDAFQGELPQYGCWAGEEGWPHTWLATLNKFRLAKGWALVIILIRKMKSVGAQQVVLKSLCIAADNLFSNFSVGGARRFPGSFRDNY